MKEKWKTDPDDITQVYISDTHSVQREVVCAAIRVGDIILCSARHWDPLMRAQAKAMGIKGTDNRQEQGFIDQYGQFMDRKEGKIIALASGQRLRCPDIGTQLYSEDLY
jgi:hypothetical protein